MTDQFTTPAEPGSGDKLPLDELKGALLLFTVHEAVMNMETVHGTANPARCDVAVLDGPHKGDTYPDTLIFPRVLAGQLSKSVGAKVLGRVGQGQKQPGKNPPWIIDAPTDDDKATARKYLDYVAAQAAADTEEPF